ncbi:hypothetical protein ACROYT_G003801 [Oculina patagonica]
MRIFLTTCLIWIIFNSSEVKGDCNYELGMQSKGIPDANISASSRLSANHVPALARLDDPQGAWCSALNDNSPYIQVLLGKEKSITKIMTQGSLKDLRWATKYQIKYLEKGKWFVYRKADGSLTLDGNTNVQSLKGHDLQPPITTGSIRIYPMAPQGVTPNVTLAKVSCLRLELYGCSAPVNGGWGDWSRWSECSVSCGFGMRSRERKCDSPKPQYRGAPCNEAEKVGQEKCRIKECQVIDGGWGKWSRWSECSLTCGLGMRSRERKCARPNLGRGYRVVKLKEWKRDSVGNGSVENRKQTFMKDIPAQDMTGTHTQAKGSIMGSRQDLVRMGGIYTAKMQFGETVMTRTTVLEF